MAESLTDDIALALLANTIATAAALAVLISVLGPISGAHFNPAVSLVMALRRDLSWRDCAAYIAAQIAGGIIGTITAHAMFDHPLLALSDKVRAGGAQWYTAFRRALPLLSRTAQPLGRAEGIHQPGPHDGSKVAWIECEARTMSFPARRAAYAATILHTPSSQ